MGVTTAVQLLQEYPELVIVVGIVARLARAWQTQLSWAEYRLYHRLKRGVFPVVDSLAGGAILWVSDKGGRDDAEYIDTIELPHRDVVSALKRAGGSLHLLNSLKRRPDTHGDPLSIAHVVWHHVDGKQTEAYLFRNNNGSTDLYAHVETSVDDPLGHLTDEQLDGDTRGVLKDVDFDNHERDIDREKQ
jgi:hypothetical protein